MNIKSIYSTFIAILFVSTIVGCASQAVVTDVVEVPNGFDRASEISIGTEQQFLDEVVGKSLKLVHTEIQADLLFNEDKTASGKIIRGDGQTQDMLLDWTWEGDAYCRTGIIGDSKTDHKCETVMLVPGVGVRLSYKTGDDPDEYWIFQ